MTHRVPPGVTCCFLGLDDECARQSRRGVTPQVTLFFAAGDTSRVTAQAVLSSDTKRDPSLQRTQRPADVIGTDLHCFAKCAQHLLQRNYVQQLLVRVNSSYSQLLLARATQCGACVVTSQGRREWKQWLMIARACDGNGGGRGLPEKAVAAHFAAPRASVLCCECVRARSGRLCGGRRRQCFGKGLHLRGGAEGRCAVRRPQWQRRAAGGVRGVGSEEARRKLGGTALPAEGRSS